MKEQCDFPAFTAYLLEDDILHIEIKQVDKLYPKDIEQVKDYFIETGMGDKVFTLTTFQGFIPIGYETMKAAVKYFKQNMIGAKACAVENLALRMTMRLFIKFYKPNYPIAIFNTQHEALAWLKEQKIKEKKKTTSLDAV
ncbi:MAG: hypothetical protein HY840_00830 [Bacteroidetes bacterium]|nr:hypothetical protein [Bacteroidota bacterium]